MSLFYSTIRSTSRTAVSVWGRRFSSETTAAAAATVPTPAPAASTTNTPHNNTTNQHDGKQLWCVISGFSRSVHRIDLENVLGDIRPLRIEPLLDPRYYPSGLYALQLQPKQYEQLNKHLLLSYKHKFKLTTDANEWKKYHRASELKIDSKTVRVRGYRHQILPQRLFYLYNNFNLRRREPVRIMKREEQYVCLLHFLTTEDAERFVAEKGVDTVDEREVGMFHYQA